VKKIFITVLLVGLAIFLSMGCITKQVWTDKVRGVPYQERILSFYNNKDEGKIIFIGEKYHYIFDKGTKEFTTFLEAKKGLKLKENHLGIYATTNRRDREKVEVSLNFEFKKSNLTQEQQSWLEGHNARFIRRPLPRKDGDDYDIPVIYAPEQMEIDGYVLNYHLLGKRYQATAEVNNHVVKLKNPINIEVVEFKVTDKKSTLYKVAMTPLSVTADAGLIIIGAGVAIIYAPFALANWAYESITK